MGCWGQGRAKGPITCWPQAGQLKLRVVIKCEPVASALLTAWPSVAPLPWG